MESHDRVPGTGAGSVPAPLWAQLWVSTLDSLTQHILTQPVCRSWDRPHPTQEGLREVQAFTQSHTAGERQTRDSSPGLWDSRAPALTQESHSPSQTASRENRRDQPHCSATALRPQFLHLYNEAVDETPWFQAWIHNRISWGLFSNTEVWAQPQYLDFLKPCLIPGHSNLHRVTLHPLRWILKVSFSGANHGRR